MGNVTLSREDARDVWAFTRLEQVWRDVRHGVRALRREPAFAATALLTLSLGTATLATVFALTDAELWRPLPFPQPERLVAASSVAPGPRGGWEPLTPADFLDWRSQARLAAYATEGTFGRRALRRSTPESAVVQAVTSNYFEVLGIMPRLGRPFASGRDDRASVAVISDRGWRRLFDGSPDIVGTTIVLDDVETTIVGVLAGQPLELNQGNPDLFVVFDPAERASDRRTRSIGVVIARLADGATIGQAQAELQSIAARIAASFPVDHTGHRVEMEGLAGFYASNNWRPLFFFLAAAAMVLILSCLNVANLLLARALRRQREFAIRGALGGGRAALVRQLVVEGALLAVPAAAMGTLLASWAMTLLGTQMPEDYLARGGHFRLDAHIAAFAIGVSAVITIALSLAPLVFARRVELNPILGQGGRTAGRTRSQVRSRNALLVAQLSLTLVLLAAAGIFLTSFRNLVDAPLGFEPSGRLALRFTLPASRYAGDEAYRAFAARLLEDARATPGAAGAEVASSSPLLSGPVMRLAAADRPRPDAGDQEQAIVRSVGPEYFRVLGVRIVEGRAFTPGDVAGAPRVVVLNDYVAARLFPGESAVGKPVELIPRTAGQAWTQRPGHAVVVGVIAHVKDISVSEVDFGNVYLPFAQAPAPTVELIVRTAIAPAGLVQPLRAAAGSIDPALPPSRVETLPDRVSDSLRGARFNLVLIASFAALAILLAAVGIYGSMACAVQERQREFGIRLALGQPPAAILRATVGRAVRLAIAGAAIGLALSLVIARLIGNALYLVRGQHSGLLYGVTTSDPAALGSAAAAMIVIAVMSGLIPARQATRVDPLIALRSE
jgi:putative ABC transport system permease protein